MINKNPIEIYETPEGGARFYFSHSDKNFTTGVLILQPKAALPRHNRPFAFENLTQVFGKCNMSLFDENNERVDYELKAGEGIRMPEGQWHIHGNPYNEISVTLFKAEGDITEIMNTLRQMNRKLETNNPKNL